MKWKFSLLIVTLFLLSTFTEAKVSNKVYTDEERQFEDYYSKLTNLISSSKSELINHFKDYLETNPKFERTYPQLLQHFSYENKIEAAKSYFDSLKIYPEYRRNSLWMLAKIMVLQDKYSIANKLYLKALSLEEPTFLLIDDYIAFDHQNRNKFRSLKMIDSLELNSYSKDIASVCYHRRINDFEITETAINKIFSRDSTDYIALHILAYCKSKQKRYNEAESIWLRGLQLVQNVGDLHAEIYYLKSLGFINNTKRKHNEAISYHENALKNAEQIRDVFYQQVSLGDLGRVYYSSGDFGKAFDYYNSAIEIAYKLKNKSSLARHYYGKAQIFYKISNYEQVNENFQISEKYANDINNISLLFSLYLEKGKLYSQLNLPSLEKHEYQKAYEISKDNPLKFMGFAVLIRIANTLIKDYKFSHARELYTRVINISNRKVSNNQKAYGQWKLADSYYKEGKLDFAKNEFVKAFELADKLKNRSYANELKAYSRLKIANIEIKQKNYLTAMEIFNETLIDTMADVKSQIEIDQLTGLATVHEKINDLEKAITHFSEAISIVENERESLSVEQFRIGYFSNNSDLYNSLIDCYFLKYLENNDIRLENKLFSLIEKSRARTLKEMVAKDKSKAKRLKENPNYHQFVESCDKFHTIQKQLRFQSDLYDSLQFALTSARFNLLQKQLLVFEKEVEKTEEKIVDLIEVKDFIQQNNLGLLLYQIHQDNSFVFVINEFGTEIIPLSLNYDLLTASLDTLLSPFHYITAENLEHAAFRADIANQLYETLVKPIEEKTTLPEHILVVPDIEFMGLPFEMLLNQPPNKKEYTLLDSIDCIEHFLVNHNTFEYSPSSWLAYQEKKQIDPPQTNILVMANPMDSDQDLAKQEKQFALRAGLNFSILWYADEEARKIEQLNSNVKVFKREQATKESFFTHAPDFRFLHFATHAFSDTMFDAFSGLALACETDSTDDGLLMGYEIAGMDLGSCELVTLSACESGRGQKVKGEGLLGLPRSFLAAGADRVLMTLWKVDDKYSSMLMTKFYDNFLNKGLQQADALNQAKKELFFENDETRNLNYQHPFFWASYTLYGKPDISKQSNIFFRLVIMLLILSIVSIVIIYLVRYKKVVCL